MFRLSSVHRQFKSKALAGVPTQEPQHVCKSLSGDSSSFGVDEELVTNVPSVESFRTIITRSTRISPARVYNGRNQVHLPRTFGTELHCWSQHEALGIGLHLNTDLSKRASQLSKVSSQSNKHLSSKTTCAFEIPLRYNFKSQQTAQILHHVYRRSRGIE